MPVVAPNNIRTTLGASLAPAATQIQLATGFGATLKAALLSGANYDGSNALGTGQTLFLSVGGPGGEIIRVAGPWNNATADLIGGAAGGTFTRQSDGTTHSGATWASGTVAEVLDPRALIEALAQVDRAQTWSAAQTMNDGTVKHLGGERYATLGGTTIAGGTPAAAAAAEAVTFSHGLAGNTDVGRVATVMPGSTLPYLYQPGHDDCSIAKAWPSGTTTSAENCQFARHFLGPTAVVPVSPAVDKRGVYQYVAFPPTASGASAGISTDTANPWTVARQATLGEGRWSVTFMWAHQHASIPSSGARFAIGVSSIGGGSGGNTALVTTNDPSLQAQDCILIAADAGDTQLKILTGNGTSTDKTAMTTPRLKTALDGYYIARIANGAGDGTNMGAITVELLEFANGSFACTVLHRGTFAPAGGFVPRTGVQMYPVWLKGTDTTIPWSFRYFQGVTR